ncbi:MAG: response regulator transcription factor [Bacillota bacterium]|nr:response regulator transcription factor [Bacillota bacterium]
MKKIFVTDDHTMVRDAFVKVLELTNNTIVVGSASSGEECLEKLAVAEPDVLLLDINMPGMNGIDVLKEVKSKYPAVKVIMLTVHDDHAYIADAVKSGADGYVLKGSEVETLEKAINTVCQGTKYFSPSVQGMLNSKKSDHDEDVLTSREKQVLNLLAEGYSNRNISEELEVSEKTVKNHLSSIFKKIGVSDRTNAVIYALKGKNKQ